MVDAREYLKYFTVAESRIDLKFKQIRNLEDRLCSISPHMDAEQVSHTRNTTVMADTIAVIVDIQNEIDQQTSEIFRKKQEAYRILDQMSPKNADILIEHYFNRKTLIGISRSTGISERQIQRRLHDAVTEFQKILNAASP